MVMHVEALGQGRDIVLVHGWGLHGGVWRGLAGRLAASFRVLLPDLPGHGRSPAANGDFTLADVVAELQGHMTAPAVWVGWSLGALVALTAARRFPQRVSRLVLIGATPKFVQAPDWPCAMPLQTLAQFARDLEDDYHATLVRFLSLQMGSGDVPGCTSAANAGSASAAVRQLRALLMEHGEPEPAALRSGLQWLADTDLRADLPAITAPALVLHGQHDRLVPPAAAEFLARQLPAARLALIRSAGHAPFLSHPDATWSALTEFLRA
jgi:pimeloyl-[acyl-carrier protein] methyl ester esterase